MANFPSGSAPLPDAAHVEALAGYGLSAGEISRIFDLEEQQLKDAFVKDLSVGEAKANAAENFYRKGDWRRARGVSIGIGDPSEGHDGERPTG